MTSESTPPANRHAPTPVERQRAQLEKLLKDPSKPAYVPQPPKEKGIRPPREMMKNVQGSSAGAGSGEFHVYKASRRREYERLKLLDETSQKETEAAEFERRRREAEQESEAKTAKNRAKRQKKKERAKGSKIAPSQEVNVAERGGAASDVVVKKRRLVNGKEMVFRKPAGDGSDDGEDVEQDVEGTDELDSSTAINTTTTTEQPQKIVIYED